MFAAGIVGVDVKKNFRFEIGAGYSSYQYVLVAYDNPSNYNGFPDTSSDIPFSSLTPKEILIKESYVLFPMGAYYKFGGQNKWSLKAGFRADLFYTLSTPFEYFYYTGELTKRQKSDTYSIGPTGLQSRPCFELRPQYRLSGGTELGITLKYSATGSQIFSLWTEF